MQDQLIVQTYKIKEGNAYINCILWHCSQENVIDNSVSHCDGEHDRLIPLVFFP